MTLRIGKAHLHVTSEGCIKCGVTHSFNWAPAQVLAVTIGDRKPFPLTVHVCGACMAADREAIAHPAPAGPGGQLTFREVFAVDATLTLSPPPRAGLTAVAGLPSPPPAGGATHSPPPFLDPKTPPGRSGAGRHPGGGASRECAVPRGRRIG